ncbi:hypothetical protein [Bacteroidetes bacterium endosymbiont of Geopemphigus sp.]|uniref:hypothetical protein n=1 Tax=Bacteroidetes bacterium endosymbiont of Geopemphigus sp. TaxID=2047937 RepID=UPI0018A80F32|nr:hypothetical protein [Bacteroidetes bacterium endosymbiont of Geopemphigus sp.]
MDDKELIKRALVKRCEALERTLSQIIINISRGGRPDRKQGFGALREIYEPN